MRETHSCLKPVGTVTQPEVDSQLQEVQQPEYGPAGELLHPGVPLEVLVAVPEPAESLDQGRGAQDEEQQQPQAHVGLLLVEGHNSPNIQPDVEQQEDQTQAGEHKVQPGVAEHAHDP